MFVDSHCHLSFPELKGKLAEIRIAMRLAEVDRALCICTTLEEFDEVQALALGHDNFWCSAGVHPDNEGVLEPRLEDLLELASRPRVVAIGETGLDYFRLNGRSHEQMAWQRERFQVHIEAAKQCGLPLIVHTRAASEDTLSLLKEAGLLSAGGVFHCFTEGMEVAKAALDLGFFISFSGILTFRNASELRDVARFVPIDRCLIETDSPYLAPVPHRGQINNPAYVVHVAEQLAALKGLALADVAALTSRNFETLFPRVMITP